MTTGEIGDMLDLTAKLMELHGENPFKVKALANAAFKLGKVSINLNSISDTDLEKIEGIGKGIAHKIIEIRDTGKLSELDVLINLTPKGLIEMMQIKGLGPKKIAALWKGLEIESVGELLYACNENRLTSLKGFGIKTQEQIKKNIEFAKASQGKLHYADAEIIADEVCEKIKKENHQSPVSIVGEVRRKCEVVSSIEILVGNTTHQAHSYSTSMPAKVKIHRCSKQEFAFNEFMLASSEKHLSQLNINKNELLHCKDDKEIYEKLGMQHIEPELREGHDEVRLAKKNMLPKLITLDDIKGSFHNHSTYSDGVHSIKEMAEECIALGYAYLGICDHSKSAFYANGLDSKKIEEQHKEIDILNIELAPFKIYKGIESDILPNGSLDYEEDILKSFDLIVASVHSVLKMDKEKATNRLIKAIENPYTTMLGHMTGRLLLSREGYPVDHKKIIAACAANNVIIELNAHPYRLDIDWRWISYCVESGVKISINPDAHSKEGLHDMYYGVCVARKGMLTKEDCFNSQSIDMIDAALKKKRNND